MNTDFKNKKQELIHSMIEHGATQKEATILANEIMPKTYSEMKDIALSILVIIVLIIICISVGIDI